MSSIDKPPRLSVVIVTWNSKNYISGCIASVAGGAGSSSHEILVVDNASSDGTPDEVERAWPQVKLFRNEENRGLTAANNQGAAEARGEYVLFLNPDTRLTEGSLERLADVLDQNPDIGALGPRLIDEEGVLSRDMGHREPTAFTVFNSFLLTSRLSQSLFPGIHRTRDVRGLERCDWLCGACILVRRAVADSVGWGEFGLGDDLDYCLRISSAGWRVAVTGEASVVHYAGRSWTKAHPRTLGGTPSRIAARLYDRGPFSAALGIASMRLGLHLRGAAHGFLYVLSRDPERLYKAQKVRQFLAHDELAVFRKRNREVPRAYPG